MQGFNIQISVLDSRCPVDIEVDSFNIELEGTAGTSISKLTNIEGLTLQYWSLISTFTEIFDIALTFNIEDHELRYRITPLKIQKSALIPITWFTSILMYSVMCSIICWFDLVSFAIIQANPVGVAGYYYQLQKNTQLNSYCSFLFISILWQRQISESVVPLFISDDQNTESGIF